MVFSAYLVNGVVKHHQRTADRVAKDVKLVGFI